MSELHASQRIFVSYRIAIWLLANLINKQLKSVTSRDLALQCY